MINWSKFERCNADCTIRHFTPLYIGDLNIKDIPNTPVTPPSEPEKPVTPIPNEPNKPKPTPNYSIINLWDGDINDFYSTNRNNYIVVNNFITDWNNSSNSFLEPLTFKLDDTNYSEVNRLAYRQFINNAKILLEQIPKMVDDYRVTDYDFTCVPPKLPTGIDFNRTEINNFWSWVRGNLSWIKGQVQQME